MPADSYKIGDTRVMNGRVWRLYEIELEGEKWMDDFLVDGTGQLSSATMAALSASPARGEGDAPVAWRWRFDADGEWSYGGGKPGKFRFGQPEEVEPLYTHPTPATPAVKGEVTDEWAERFCEAVNWSPDGQECKTVEGQLRCVSFRDLAKGYILAAIATDPCTPATPEGEELREKALIAIRDDRATELPIFLDALGEWGCDDTTEQAKAILQFLSSSVGVSQWREEEAG